MLTNFFTKPFKLRTFKMFATFFFMVLVLAMNQACHKSEGIVSDISPENIISKSNELELSNFVTETVASDSIITDEFKCTYSYLGNTSNEIFGTLQSAFIAQFGLLGEVDINEIVQKNVTSFNQVSLTLEHVASNYGKLDNDDSLRHIQIYKLSKATLSDKSYYSSTNAEAYITGSDLIFDGLVSLNPNKTTLKINLPVSGFSYLLSNDNLYNLTSDNIKGIFKGIYIKEVASAPKIGGGICAFDLRNSNTKLSLGYLAGNIQKNITLTVNSDCRRFNIYKNESSGKINSFNNENKNIYIQGFASTNAKIYCNLHKLLKDSLPISIVNATLELSVNETVNIGNVYYPNIPKLILRYIDSDNVIRVFKDELLENAYNIGGNLTTSNKYVFTITQTLQDILNRGEDIKGFLLACDNGNNIPKNVVIKNGNDIKIKIKYTKL